MKIKIEYCVVWNYFPKASRVEQEIKLNFPESSVELVEGRGGVFDVYLGDKLIFSKNAMHSPRFPESGEIPELINKEVD